LLQRMSWNNVTCYYDLVQLNECCKILYVLGIFAVWILQKE
jgi:hypothetical protein